MTGGNENIGKNYYSVACGKKTGICKTWGQCHKWTNKVSGSLHEGFENLDDAIQFMFDNTSLSRESIKVFDGRGTELVPRNSTRHLPLSTRDGEHERTSYRYAACARFDTD